MAALDYVIVGGLAAVTMTLGLGLINMMRGGPASRSQHFMRWRVLLQAALIGLIVLAFAL